MDYLPGSGNEEPWETWRVATRDEVEAALAQRPDMARILVEQLVSDVRSTLGWSRTEAESFVLDTAAVMMPHMT